MDCENSDGEVSTGCGRVHSGRNHPEVVGSCGKGKTETFYCAHAETIIIYTQFRIRDSIRRIRSVRPDVHGVQRPLPPLSCIQLKFRKRTIKIFDDLEAGDARCRSRIVENLRSEVGNASAESYVLASP